MKCSFILTLSLSLSRSLTVGFLHTQLLSKYGQSKGKRRNKMKRDEKVEKQILNYYFIFLFTWLPFQQKQINWFVIWFLRLIDLKHFTQFVEFDFNLPPLFLNNSIFSPFLSKINRFSLRVFRPMLVIYYYCYNHHHCVWIVLINLFSSILQQFNRRVFPSYFNPSA